MFSSSLCLENQQYWENSYSVLRHWRTDQILEVRRFVDRWRRRIKTMKRQTNLLRSATYILDAELKYHKIGGAVLVGSNIAPSIWNIWNQTMGVMQWSRYYVTQSLSQDFPHGFSTEWKLIWMHSHQKRLFLDKMPQILCQFLLYLFVCWTPLFVSVSFENERINNTFDLWKNSEF